MEAQVKKIFKFKSKVFLYQGKDPWHFARVDEKTSAKLKKDFGAKSRGWSSLPVEVSIRKNKWQTSVFFEKRSGTYLLPLKAKVRKESDIYEGDIISYSIKILI